MTRKGQAEQGSEARRRKPRPPNKRAFVFIPVALFWLLDTVLLAAAGRSIGSAVLLAAASAVLVGWILNRRFEGIQQRYQRHAREASEQASEQAGEQAGAPTPPNGTGSLPQVHTATEDEPAAGNVRPPVGSWSNPSGGQKLRDRWDRAMPFARRHRRPGDRHRD